jgi:hypothetical protein
VLEHVGSCALPVSESVTLFLSFRSFSPTPVNSAVGVHMGLQLLFWDFPKAITYWKGFSQKSQ